ncbi:MAG: D-alanine--D-alanine ligase [Kiritimatiellae bacterium]|nr:D-alanine--D-alanine ligase [Kiritimatiellia bacterium]
MMKKIAVLMGGRSSEREVSLASGRNVAEALASLGKYDVLPMDLKDDSLDGLPDGIDAVYIALHGGWGENGGVQAALNARKIPYTGPGVQASQIAMDKVKTKMVLEMNAIPTAAWGLANRDTPSSPLPLPVVVKPPCDGSSVGISKVSSADGWAKARDLAFEAIGSGGDVVLVEEFVPGREFTVGVIDGEALPVIEIVAKNGWYGYHEKYDSDETRYPFLEDAALSEKLKKIAVDAYRAVGCRGVTRVDFRVSPLGRCYVLELNTSPGFTSHSLVPKAGMKTGLSIAEVCDKILSSAEFDR